MASSNPTKVLLLGPTKSGKTTLANFLSDAKDAIGQYRPTVGCRILEFQIESSQLAHHSSSRTNNNNTNNSEIQLWDCSADRNVSNCLPALANDAAGVLLVYDITADDHTTELEELYNVWNNYLELSPSRYLIVARKWGDGQPNRKRTIKMGTLARLSRVEWDIDSDGHRVQNEFSSFMSSVLLDIRPESL
ncbi:hypothetical protein DAPPUDRAFT_239205 [Daphnia pulex]|uniref:Intraflagellar transport protein 22 homolog n=1 Tax=Daphnia pulex TaxID=6669 RepID=E9G8M4_DAPPU|nr:hypothetical protein DAPPUDRAFT_239205 [Daphnia pulex]|eukprot:EFX83996.1 hypothetical protein DAPPUDRAFT_239205 [Daphnia pulex]